jgi:hypothetical protein
MCVFVCAIGGCCIIPDGNWEECGIYSWDEIYNYGRFVELGEILRVEGLHKGLWGTKGSYALLAFMGLISTRILA